MFMFFHIKTYIIMAFLLIVAVCLGMVIVILSGRGYSSLYGISGQCLETYLVVITGGMCALLTFNE